MIIYARFYRLNDSSVAVNYLADYVDIVHRASVRYRRDVSRYADRRYGQYGLAYPRTYSKRCFPLYLVERRHYLTHPWLYARYAFRDTDGFAHYPPNLAALAVKAAVLKLHKFQSTLGDIVLACFLAAQCKIVVQSVFYNPVNIVWKADLLFINAQRIVI